MLQMAADACGRSGTDPVVRAASGPQVRVEVSLRGMAGVCSAISVLLWKRVGSSVKEESTHQV